MKQNAEEVIFKRTKFNMTYYKTNKNTAVSCYYIFNIGMLV